MTPKKIVKLIIFSTIHHQLNRLPLLPVYVSYLHSVACLFEQTNVILIKHLSIYSYNHALLERTRSNSNRMKIRSNASHAQCHSKWSTQLRLQNCEPTKTATTVQLETKMVQMKMTSSEEWNTMDQTHRAWTYCRYPRARYSCETRWASIPSIWYRTRNNSFTDILIRPFRKIQINWKMTICLSFVITVFIWDGLRKIVASNFTYQF